MKKPETAKERNLIKGSIRRVFSRSELRRQAIAKAQCAHRDPNRKRVTKWGRCEQCQTLTPLYLMEVDHILPVIPLDKTLDDMTWDEVVESLWCDSKNLQAICKDCHKLKTKEERRLRKAQNVKKKSI